MAGFGPPLIDFSPLANLGKSFFDAQSQAIKRQESAEKQALLRTAAQGGDLGKIGLGLLAAGDVQSGAALLGLGEKAKERQDQLDYYKSSPFGGAVVPTAPSAPTAAVGNPNEIENRFVGTVKQAGLTNPVGLAAVAAYGKAESGFSPQNVNRAWSDPSESGQPGTAGGIMSWRAERLQNLQNFAKQRGETQPSVETQALFLAQEDPTLIPKLQAAQTPQEANQIMANAWRFAGYNREGGENARRLALTQQYAQRFGGQGGATVAVQPQFAETEADVQRLEAQQGNPIISPAPPLRVAQSPAQPGDPRADLPAAGASEVQGFVVPQGQNAAIPPNDPYPHVSTRQLLDVMRNPRAPAGEKTLAQQLFASRQAYSAENAPDKREMTRLQTEKLRREVEGEGARPMTPQERIDYNVPEGQPAYINRQGEPKFGPAGTRITNANTFDGKGESKFNEALGAAQAKRWNGYIEEGDVAQNRIADIQTLREASRRLGSQGSSANLKATIGPYAESLGIRVEGLSDIQLYESITNRLAPTLRAAGSGSTSDIEFRGFQRAIGPLSNTPAAREMILDTFEAASRNDIARAEIASRLAEGQISRGQAEKEIRALPNPLEAFRKFREANPDLVGQAIKESVLTARDQKNAPPVVNSAEAYSQLKPGDRYTDPDGNVRTKR